MSSSITAVFDSVDDAERAMSRLRRTVSDFQVRINGGPHGATPADAPYTASILYPYQPINLPQNFANEYDYELGGRVIFTADILGLPIYQTGQTELHLTVNELSAEKARSVLRNAGGRDIR